MPPGQEGRLKVTVKTSAYHGNVSKAVSVQSDDPVRPNLTLKVNMSIIGSALILPSSRLVLRVRPDEPVESRMLIRKDPTETGTLKVDELTSSEEWLKVSVRPAKEGETVDRGFQALPGDFMLVARVPESPGGGMHRAEISFRTTLPREPVITVPVTMSSRRFGNPTVSQLILRREQADGLMAGRMSFRLRSRVDPASVEVRITSDRYRVEVTTPGEGQLQVLVTENPEKGNDEPLPAGTLIFSRGRETINVPVRPLEQ